MTRWYGGTKLGVGGLVRAYGEAAALALAEAPRRVGTGAARVSMRYPYAQTAAVMRAMERAGAVEMAHGYADSGAAGVLDASVPESRLAGLEDELREATGGAVGLERGDAVVLYRNADT